MIEMYTSLSDSLSLSLSLYIYIYIHIYIYIYMCVCVCVCVCVCGWINGASSLQNESVILGKFGKVFIFHSFF